MPSYRIVTLGCKVSRADAGDVERALISAGLEPAPGDSPASLCVICGCAVTGVAEGKSRRAIGRIRRENPGAAIVAAGCIATKLETDGQSVAAPASIDVLANVDAVVPAKSMGRIAEILSRLPQLEGTNIGDTEPLAGPFPGRTRAILKVQDGCGGACSYCIVPRLRGMPRSRPLSDVLEAARGLIEAGHAEIVLAGVRLGGYSDPTAGHGLMSLVTQILEMRSLGLKRIRLSSIEPMDFDMSLAELAAQDRGLCPHFHLPLQSGDDGILKGMNRPYDVAEYMRVLEGIRDRVPDAAITTDIIAGFPGETEQAHANTLALIGATRFARLHAFPFSPRPDTPAATMPGALPAQVAKQRAADLIEAGLDSAREYRRRFLGSVMEVIAEPGSDSGLLSGYTDRYMRMQFEGDRALVGSVVQVKAVEDAQYGFVGEMQ